MLVSEQVGQLNRDCYCFPLDNNIVANSIARSQPDVEPLFKRGSWFAGTGVLLAATEVEQMIGVVDAIESLVKLPPYQSEKITRQSDTGDWLHGDGMLMGYDFHLGPDGPQLIEVNSNAGGAFIVNEMMDYCEEAYTQCCGFQTPGSDSHNRLENLLITEWHSAGREGVPKVAAIVDVNPQSEFLYPDMLIAQNYFERRGVQTLITDVASLEFKNGKLLCDGQQIDIVYNRSTDFTLSGSSHTALREAALAGSVVVGPNPLHHALFADKNNFVYFTDLKKLEQFGLASHQIMKLKGHVPATWLLTEDNASELYQQKRSLFFKPVDGYGSQAVYRGDKMTRKVWANILSSIACGRAYIAQEIVPPSLRAVMVNGERKRLKFDVRLYTSGGAVVMAAARLYQGQTTNFRTIGGGFAPVVYMNDGPMADDRSADTNGTPCSGVIQ